MIGRKSDKDKVLLTMVERKTRNLCVLRLADKSSRSLMEAVRRMENELGQAFPELQIVDKELFQRANEMVSRIIIHRNVNYEQFLHPDTQKS